MPAPLECEANVCPCNEGGIRGAIVQGPGTYTFDCEGPTTVGTSQEIVIDEDVVLDGGGLLTVDGRQRHRVFSVPSDTTVGLIGLFIVNGNETDGHGGGVRNEGTLTIESCTLAGNSAGRETGCRTDDPSQLCSEGGAIWNSGTLSVIDANISENSAHFGGGVANRGGTLTIIDAEITMNSATGCRGVGAVVCSGGGGVWNDGTLSMESTGVRGCAADWGGGVWNRRPATLTECAIEDNESGFDGGGLFNFETLELIDTTVTRNNAGQSGGGVANASPGALSLSSSTLSMNTAASAGGGLYNPRNASAAVFNSTVSGNSAETGGGIYTGGELIVTSSTVAANEGPTGGALFGTDAAGAQRLVALSLIDGDCAGARFQTAGYNIESPGDTCGFDADSDEPAVSDLELGPLQDNGGPTETHALGAGSAAIDAVPSVDCVDAQGGALTVDQRGEPRPAGADCDVGSFEAQP